MSFAFYGPIRVLVVVASAASLVGCGNPPQSNHAEAPQVGVYRVDEQSLALTADLPGRTSAFRVAEVRPQVSGILLKRLFKEGSDVVQGQHLYQIDSTMYEAALNKASANLAATESLAKRYEELRSSDAVSKQQYDDAVSAWLQAKADVKTASVNMVYAGVLSPISGRIGRSSVSEGALVSNGQADAMATVQQIDPIYVDVTQSTLDLLKLQQALAKGELAQAGTKAAKVSLLLEDGSRYPLSGTLNFSEVSVDQGTGSVVIRATFPNPNGVLLPGMFVHATLQAGVKSNAILIPQQAVTRNVKGQPAVWVLDANSVVDLRDIEATRTLGNAWLIKTGLASGERVVTEGIQRLRPGMKVAAADAKNVDLVTDFSVANKKSAGEN